MSLLAILALLLVSCSNPASDSDTEAIPAGAYKYRAYDSTGTKVVEGWFRLDLQDSSSFEGEWHTEAVGSPENTGHQVGDGNLIGHLQVDNRIWLNFNPGWRDNNVFLYGDYSIDDISGSWIWETFVGVTNHGTFEAEMQ